TVAALAFLGIAQAASVSSLTVGSDTVEPGATGVKIEITATADDLGAYRVDVQYDSTLVTAKECKSTYGQCSIDVIGANTVRINGVDATLTGWTGDLVLGSITFDAGTTEGTAALTVDASTLVVSSVDEETLSVTPANGSIKIEAAAATDAPTATPGDLPDTGGSAGTTSTSSLAWLLAAAGLAVVAGGAWVLARAGREN
ncbi:MAG TPA: hypothetical protein VIT93_02840, partial [Dehalococcoidia bacterium]